MNPLKDNKPYYPALDGLRGIAIIFVLLYHYFNFNQHFFFGWLGVDLFFVLSGFLITTILLKTKEGSHYFRNFYARRVLRIFPLYYLILILFLVIFPLLPFYQDHMVYYNEHKLWYWLYLENWLLAFHFPPPESNALNHLWSLAIEEQFYLIWPFIIFLLRQPKALLIFITGVLILVVVSRAVIWSYHIPNFNYLVFFTFTRIDGICIGSAIALIQKINPHLITRKLTLILITLACLNFLFYFLNEPYGVLPYLALCGYTTFTLLFGLLIHKIVMNDNKLLNRMLSFPLLTFTGKISYGLYVFHWPIYTILAPGMANYFRTTLYLSNSGSLIIASIICTLVSLLISIISYYSFETKFLRLKEMFR